MHIYKYIATIHICANILFTLLAHFNAFLLYLFLLFFRLIFVVAFCPKAPDSRCYITSRNNPGRIVQIVVWNSFPFRHCYNSVNNKGNAVISYQTRPEMSANKERKDNNIKENINKGTTTRHKDKSKSHAVH